MSPTFAIVGSGPAGMYAADALLKSSPDCKIDVFEKYPAPYGLIRYGVAPDHYKTRNTSRQFARTFEEDAVGFYGNVEIGKDSKIWHFSHIQSGAKIGIKCSIGQNVNIGNNVNIGSVNFGTARDFQLKHRLNKEIKKINISLEHGSFLLMKHPTQINWLHRVPKRSKISDHRINLTFRRILG